MSIYRGVGGSGNATDDATIAEVSQLASQAATSATNAANSASEAASSASGSSTSADQAAISASNAATSATQAASSASNASGAASIAGSLAQTALVRAIAADNSAAAASNSASSALSSANTAASARDAAEIYRDAAQVSETNAETAYANTLAIYGDTTDVAAAVAAASSSASAASSSASAAAGSASAASTSATNAANSATAALASQNAAAGSASAASATASNITALFNDLDAVNTAVEASEANKDASAASASAAASSASAAATSASEAAASVASINPATLVRLTDTQTLTNKTLTSPVIDSGTANGVAYLNGSKVLTSGSALTFDGSQLDVPAGSAAAPSLSTTADANTGLFFPAADTLAVSTGGSERLRITSTGNVGIGTTTPSSTLDLGPFTGGTQRLSFEGAVSLFPLRGGGNISLAFGYQSSSTTSGQYQSSYALSTARSMIAVGALTGIRFFTDPASTVAVGTDITPTERMRIDTAGNLGLGVVPSAWSSGARAVQIGAGAAIESRTNSGYAALSSNQFINAVGNNIYIASEAATKYDQIGGQHRFFTAPSGTAGNAISFTQAMTLNASGNLGIGTSSPTARLQIGNATGLQQALISGGGYDLILGASGGAIFGFASQAISTVFNTAAVPLGIGTSASQPLLFGTANIERLRIDSSGNLGLGVTPSASLSSGLGRAIQFPNGYSVFGQATGGDTFVASNAYNSAANTYAYVASSLGAGRYQLDFGIHKWYTAPSGTAGNTISFTQAMTLDANGNLLVGTTSHYAGMIYVQPTESRLDGFVTRPTTNISYAPAKFFNSSGSAIGSIACTTTATAYNVSSDYRLKNITGPITTSGAYIDSLNPVEGTWKADGSTFVGLIAHEVQEASRTTVATGVKDGEEMQGMDYSSAEIIANLIAEVKALRVRVAALESV